jgi:N-acetylmuramoyl-L-alanine amidase
MMNPIRSAITVLAALTASSVAPAQVTEGSEPLIASDSGILPVPAVIKLIDNEVVLATGETADPLAPADDGEQADDGAMAEAVDPTADLATLVAQFRASDPGSGELECLAAGVYFESKSEPLAGQLAVGQVIANRANSGRRFPSSYCGVLFQRGQFSFVRGHSYPSVARSSRQWQTAVAIARIVDQDLHPSPVGKALFFHARRVSPGWRLTRVATLGNHVFYR